MRLRFAFAAAQSMGLFLTSEAFTPAAWRTTRTQTRSLTTSVGVGGLEDWDNDDFLESLAGKNPGAGAGDGDDLPDENLDSEADISEEMKEKMAEDDETFGGGNRFKEMMEKAKGRSADDPPPVSMKNPFAENPFAGIPGLDPEAAPATPAAPAETPAFDNMTVEQQAEMFRAMMKGQPVAPVAPAAPTQAIRPEKPDRKKGRNRDADTIQNTADVYFAQLKRDSTVRGVARLRGDDDTANSVFEDEKIKELETMLHSNPHLAGQRAEEQKMIDAAAEEMMAFNAAKERKPSFANSMSYKEKLALRRNKNAGGTAASAAPAEPPAQPKVAEPVAEAPPAPVAKEPVVKAAPAQPVAESAPLRQKTLESLKDKGVEVFLNTRVTKEAPAPAAPEPVVAAAPKPQPASPAPAPQQSTPAPASEWGNSDEIRRGLRTLMGFILKHRGGPGFGAGGLKGEEIGQYEQLKEEITALLKEEAQAHHTGPTAAVAPPAPVAAAPAAPAVPDTAQASDADAAQVESMLACTEGAMLMYKNSPEELKEGVLMTVRAALLSAVNTCNKVVGQNEDIPSTAGAGASVDSMFACVGGAIQMYRNSPPELQQSVLLTVRAALLSAIGTCNKIVAENDVQNFEQYKEATADVAKPASAPKPTQFYNVMEAPDEVQAPDEPEVAATIGVDANTVVLEDIYNKLEAASGSGKMGLRDDLTSDEASELADDIAEMRSILMDELNNGIPEVETPAAATAGASEDSPSSDSGSSKPSMYQKMLAQARANKEN